MKIQEIFSPIREDLEAVEDVLHRESSVSRIPLLSSVGEHILSGGGKRFRPALTLLCGHLAGTMPEQSIPLAASIELIHNSTLLHDDIVDKGAVRRGKPAAHLIWGDTAGVLAANFHFSRAFSLILKAGGMPCLQVVSQTINIIVEGELLQFLNVGFAEMGEEGYREIILRKTARLIATACQLGALPGPGSTMADPLFRFGLELGMAYQMMDDLLDYTARESALGKKIGTDFCEGKFTLPLIVTLSRCNQQERDELQRILGCDPDERAEHFPWAKALMESHGGFEHTLQAARIHNKRALEEVSSLPEMKERQALVQLAHFVLERSH